MAFMPSMAGGMHGTSDFGSILADVANKAMLQGVAEANETFSQWTKPGTLSDFKPSKRTGLDAFPSLPVVAPGAEFKHGTMGDFGEDIVLATYGRLFSITRQAIINDDLDAFTDVPRKMGRAAIRTIGSLVYAVLNDNPDMADGTALFHANHGNLGTGGAPSVATFEEAYELMSTQKDRGGNAEALNIRPAYVLLPPSLRSQVLQVLESEHDPSKSGRTANTARGMVEPIIDARITGPAYYFAADATAIDTVEVAYLDGNQTPYLDQQDGWGIDGTEFKVRMDAGVKPLMWEGLVKNAGA